MANRDRTNASPTSVLRSAHISETLTGSAHSKIFVDRPPSLSITNISSKKIRLDSDGREKERRKVSNRENFVDRGLGVVYYSSPESSAPYINDVKVHHEERRQPPVKHERTVRTTVPSVPRISIPETLLTQQPVMEESPPVSARSERLQRTLKDLCLNEGDSFAQLKERIARQRQKELELRQELTSIPPEVTLESKFTSQAARHNIPAKSSLDISGDEGASAVMDHIRQPSRTDSAIVEVGQFHSRNEPARRKISVRPVPAPSSETRQVLSRETQQSCSDQRLASLKGEVHGARKSSFRVEKRSASKDRNPKASGLQNVKTSRSARVSESVRTPPVIRPDTWRKCMALVNEQLAAKVKKQPISNVLSCKAEIAPSSVKESDVPDTSSQQTKTVDSCKTHSLPDAKTHKRIELEQEKPSDQKKEYVGDGMKDDGAAQKTAVNLNNGDEKSSSRGGDNQPLPEDQEVEFVDTKFISEDAKSVLRDLELESETDQELSDSEKIAQPSRKISKKDHPELNKPEKVNLPPRQRYYDTVSVQQYMEKKRLEAQKQARLEKKQNLIKQRERKQRLMALMERSRRAATQSSKHNAEALHPSTSRCGPMDLDARQSLELQDSRVYPLSTQGMLLNPNSTFTALQSSHQLGDGLPTQVQSSGDPNDNASETMSHSIDSGDSTLTELDLQAVTPLKGKPVLSSNLKTVEQEMDELVRSARERHRFHSESRSKPLPTVSASENQPLSTSLGERAKNSRYVELKQTTAILMNKLDHITAGFSQYSRSLSRSSERDGNIADSARGMDRSMPILSRNQRMVHSAEINGYSSPMPGSKPAWAAVDEPSDSESTSQISESASEVSVHDSHSHSTVSEDETHSHSTVTSSDEDSELSSLDIRIKKALSRPSILRPSIRHNTHNVLKPHPQVARGLDFTAGSALGDQHSTINVYLRKLQEQRRALNNSQPIRSSSEAALPTSSFLSQAPAIGRGSPSVSQHVTAVNGLSVGTSSFAGSHVPFQSLTQTVSSQVPISTSQVAPFPAQVPHFISKTPPSTSYSTVTSREWTTAPSSFDSSTVKVHPDRLGTGGSLGNVQGQALTFSAQHQTAISGVDVPLNSQSIMAERLPHHPHSPPAVPSFSTQNSLTQPVISSAYSSASALRSTPVCLPSAAPTVTRPLPATGSIYPDPYLESVRAGASAERLTGSRPAATPQHRISPSSLDIAMAASISRLDGISQQELHLANVERSRFSALAQQESVALAQLLKGTKDKHAEELHSLRRRLRDDELESERQIQKLREETAQANLRSEMTRKEMERDAKILTSEATLQVIQAQSESTRALSAATKMLAERKEALLGTESRIADSARSVTDSLKSQTEAVTASLTALMENQRQHSMEMLRIGSTSLKPPLSAGGTESRPSRASGTDTAVQVKDRGLQVTPRHLDERSPTSSPRDSGKSTVSRKSSRRKPEPVRSALPSLRTSSERSDTSASGTTEPSNQALSYSEDFSSASRSPSFSSKQAKASVRSQSTVKTQSDLELTNGDLTQTSISTEVKGSGLEHSSGERHSSIDESIQTGTGLDHTSEESIRTDVTDSPRKANVVASPRSRTPPTATSGSSTHDSDSHRSAEKIATASSRVRDSSRSEESLSGASGNNSNSIQKVVLGAVKEIFKDAPAERLQADPFFVDRLHSVLTALKEGRDPVAVSTPSKPPAVTSPSKPPIVAPLSPRMDRRLSTKRLNKRRSNLAMESESDESHSIFETTSDTDQESQISALQHQLEEAKRRHAMMKKARQKYELQKKEETYRKQIQYYEEDMTRMQREMDELSAQFAQPDKHGAPVRPQIKQPRAPSAENLESNRQRHSSAGSDTGSAGDSQHSNFLQKPLMGKQLPTSQQSRRSSSDGPKTGDIHPSPGASTLSSELLSPPGKSHLGSLLDNSETKTYRDVFDTESSKEREAEPLLAHLESSPVYSSANQKDVVREITTTSEDTVPESIAEDSIASQGDVASSESEALLNINGTVEIKQPVGEMTTGQSVRKDTEQSDSASSDQTLLEDASLHSSVSNSSSSSHKSVSKHESRSLSRSPSSLKSRSSSLQRSSSPPKAESLVGLSGSSLSRQSRSRSHSNNSYSDEFDEFEKSIQSASEASRHSTSQKSECSADRPSLPNAVTKAGHLSEDESVISEILSEVSFEVAGQTDSGEQEPLMDVKAADDEQPWDQLLVDPLSRRQTSQGVSSPTELTSGKTPKSGTATPESGKATPRKIRSTSPSSDKMKSDSQESTPKSRPASPISGKVIPESVRTPTYSLSQTPSSGKTTPKSGSTSPGDSSSSPQPAIPAEVIAALENFQEKSVAQSERVLAFSEEEEDQGESESECSWLSKEASIKDDQEWAAEPGVQTSGQVEKIIVSESHEGDSLSGTKGPIENDDAVVCSAQDVVVLKSASAEGSEDSIAEDVLKGTASTISSSSSSRSSTPLLDLAAELQIPDNSQLVAAQVTVRHDELAEKLSPLLEKLDNQHTIDLPLDVNLSAKDDNAAVESCLQVGEQASTGVVYIPEQHTTESPLPSSDESELTKAISSAAAAVESFALELELEELTHSQDVGASIMEETTPRSLMSLDSTAEDVPLDAPFSLEKEEEIKRSASPTDSERTLEGETTREHEDGSSLFSQQPDSLADKALDGVVRDMLNDSLGETLALWKLIRDRHRHAHDSLTSPADQVMIVSLPDAVDNVVDTLSAKDAEFKAKELEQNSDVMVKDDLPFKQQADTPPKSPSSPESPNTPFTADSSPLGALPPLAQTTTDVMLMNRVKVESNKESSLPDDTQQNWRRLDQEIDAVFGETDADDDWFDEDFGFGSKGVSTGVKPPPAYSERAPGTQEVIRSEVKKSLAEQLVIEPVFTVPHTKEQVLAIAEEATEIFWNGRRCGEPWDTLQPSTDFLSAGQLVGPEAASTSVFKTLIFDMVRELLLTIYQTELELPSQLTSHDMQTSQLGRYYRHRQPPRTLEEVQKIIQQHIYPIVNRTTAPPVRNRLLALARNKRRDRVDTILTQELREEESSWLDYSRDQQAVKEKLVEDVFNSLFLDTVVAFKLAMEAKMGRSENHGSKPKEFIRR